jgi:hypothetical protein
MISVDVIGDVRLAAVAVHQAKVTRCAVFRHRAAKDKLEIAFPVMPVAHVAVIEGRHDAPLRDRQCLPFSRTTLDKVGPLVPNSASARSAKRKVCSFTMVLFAPDAIGSTSASSPAAAASSTSDDQRTSR